MTLRFVSAGAAHGLVEAIARERSVDISGSFGAVGAMLEKLDGGEPADVIILTHAQVAALEAQSRVVRGSVADLGIVPTSIAVRSADPAPDVGSEAGLRAALLAADTIHFPDPGRATAGIHFAKVLERLGLREALQARLRTHPNGATAMRSLAAAEGHPIGCTQATEILATAGVRLVGPLPRGYELDTIYTVAVHAHAADPEAAGAFVRALTSAQSRERRAAAGFREG
ncbi:MAG TPA: substrate-binding domain-containing protein [Usitatibacter sp.]|nr:substrate-binding domain-containing protein [Usitatibacter sp.]